MPSETETTTTYAIDLRFDEALNTRISNILRSKDILGPVEPRLTIGVAHAEAQTCSSALSILENVLRRYITIQERFPVGLNGVELNHPVTEPRNFLKLGPVSSLMHILRCHGNFHDALRMEDPDHQLQISQDCMPPDRWEQFAKITLFNSRDQLFKAIRDLCPVFDSEPPLNGFAHQVALVELSPNPRDLSVLPLRERAASDRLVDAQE
ncbi:uncharacterized protein LOC112099984 [Citrus clementina]|uniref:uncharacterized protein LOC112099984 n=1 Tax=Citrus clementina TaxID=85681 RepID=UPI000763A80D|nr:uncharacterized protein LOC112099984 [Citrus x clementina]